MKPSTVVGIVIGFFVLIFGLTWIGEGNDFFLYKVFAPKRAAVERQVWEQSPNYIKTMVQELENMQVQYVQTKDPEAKATLAGVILHRASGFDLNNPDVSTDLRAFIEQLKREQRGQ